MKQIDEDMVLFATSIAMELAKGLNEHEIEDLRNLVNQISCSLSTLIHCRCSWQRRQEANNKKL